MTRYSQRISPMILSFMILLLIFPHQATSAPVPEIPEGTPIANNNGLSWGIEPGIYLDYYLNAEFTSNTSSYTVNNQVYYYIQYLGEIPDNLVQIPATHYSTHWANNGSQMVISEYFRFGSTTLGVYNAVVPVGNWSLLTDFFETSIFYNIPPNATLQMIENDLEWGYEITFIVIDYFVKCGSIYFKSDGTLENAWMDVTYQEEPLYTVTLTRVNVINPIFIISIIGVAIFGIITIILVIKYIKNPD